MVKYLEDKREMPIFAASNIILTTPLSAGSKTLSPLLHLKATPQGRLFIFVKKHEP